MNNFVNKWLRTLGVLSVLGGGAALMAAVGTGAFPDIWRAMAAVDAPVSVIEPVSGRRAAYDAKRFAYRELIAALRAFEDTMASHSQGLTR